MQLATIHQNLTMSSREIAELIDKQHNHIKVSADRLAAKGVIGTPAMREFTHNGNTYTEYLLNKRDSLILVAQNCPENSQLALLTVGRSWNIRLHQTSSTCPPRLPVRFALHWNRPS